MASHSKYRALYEDRKLAEGCPNLESQGVATFTHLQPEDPGWCDRFLPLLDRLVDLRAMGKQVLILGTGPKPLIVKQFEEHGFDAIGVEPISAYVRSGNEYLDARDRILLGACEAIPVADESQSLVILRSVLEHVDSPRISLREICRILKPGGVVYITTTNRLRFSITGRNDEYTTRFFNWFPPLVRESYIFHQLHYEPKIANFTPRPAVHWFTFSELCRLGRDEGFAEFFSPLDLMQHDDPRLNGSILARLAKPFILSAKYRPWLRSMLLTQLGAAIFMMKRPR